KRDGKNRSDTLMVANIDLEEKSVSMLSIPRDTRVKLADGGYHKINAAYAYGGLELTQSTVSDFLGVDIDYYLEIDYNDFVALVNAVGGVKINIAKDLFYQDQAAGLNINLKKGIQELSGAEALEYVRFRQDNLGDIGRIARQQKFLAAVIDKLLSARTILKMPQIINQLKNTVETNISGADFLATAAVFRDFNLKKIKMNTLPGKVADVNGISYWLTDDSQMTMVLDSLNFNLVKQGGFSVNGA
ncbi:MAG: LCP family protein, partial [Bacillota bacterium]